MRITPNTSLEYLMHGETNVTDDELMHWKYVKKEKINGKWRYWYDWGSVKNDTKTKVDAVASATITKANEASKGIDGLVNKAKTVINKLYDDPNNIYEVNSESYQQKMAKIKETKEWKDIVARNDSEYIKKNSDGTTTYDIDSYVVKKKHPVLDIVSDIAAGRKVDINEITKDTVVASLKDYAFGTIRTGMLAAGVVSTVLTEKFKFQQGSYDDEVAKLTDTVNKGAEYIESTAEVVSNVSPKDVERMAAAVKKGSMAAEATRTINEGNVIKAAQVIVESEQMKNLVGENEYYKMMESALTDLSDEEIAALNLLLKQMRNK